MKAFWAYMLRCADDSYYVGQTDNLEKRFGEHQRGEIPGYTSTRRPLVLIWSQEYPTREEALNAEMQIKSWNRRKKEALARGDWAGVRLAAKKNFSQHGGVR